MKQVKKHPLVVAYEAAIAAQSLAYQKADEADLVAIYCDNSATLKSECEAACTAATRAVQEAEQAVIDSDDAFPNFVRHYGQLANSFCGLILPLKVYRSGAGFYIGTYDEEGPCSRESNEYYRSEKLAQVALDSGSWTQKLYL